MVNKWKKSTSGRRFRRGGESILISNSLGKFYPGKYSVYIDDKINDKVKYFKTKKQALTYAKAYMRKH